MIRGLSPIPRGGGKPEGKEGDCITTLGALSLTEGVWVRTKLVRGVPTPGSTATPSCGFPQKSFPPEGPHDFRGHLRRSRKSDIRPKGEQRARGCVLCELRSALTRSAPVAPPRSERAPVVSKNAPNKLCSPCSPFYPGCPRAYTRLCLVCDETEARKGLGHPYEPFDPTAVTSAHACFFMRRRIGEQARPISGGLALILACGRELSCRRLARGSVTRTSHSAPPP